ncbi:MAG TPA: hypothetical protein VN844_03760 [Pyrinomonadaceae bacterium]|jgi:hypothetical protein|nr:hypothetical protein [Pyrinomonadaceae bacterium]
MGVKAWRLTNDDTNADSAIMLATVNGNQPYGYLCVMLLTVKD